LPVSEEPMELMSEQFQLDRRAKSMNRVRNLRWFFIAVSLR